MNKLLLVVISLAAFVFAQENEIKWNMYGDAGFESFFRMDNPKLEKDNKVTNTFAYNWAGSKFGGRISGENIKARVEVGFAPNPISLYLRLAYGEYSFSENVSLLIGQSYGPVNFFPCNSINDGWSALLNAGGCYHGRLKMVQLTVHDFKIALLDAGNNISGVFKGKDPIADETNRINYTVKGTKSGEFSFPKLQGFLQPIQMPNPELSYTLKGESWHITAAAGYQSFKFKANHTISGSKVDTTEYTFTSWVTGAEAAVDVGPLTVAVSPSYGQNWGFYRMYTDGMANPTIELDTTKIEGEVKNNITMGVVGCVSYKVNDKVMPQIGFGYLSHKIGIDNISPDPEIAIYIQSHFQINPRMFVIPELGMKDALTNFNNKNESQNIYAGIVGVITF